MKQQHSFLITFIYTGKSSFITDLHGESSAVAITDNDIWQYDMVTCVS